MKLLFISILLISVRYVFSAKDVGKYFELDALPTDAYLFYDNLCEKAYICRSREEHWYGDTLYNCYYRNLQVSDSFGPLSRRDPDSCGLKGYVNIGNVNCYFLNNVNSIKTIENFKGQSRVRYYDIDLQNKRALTEYGWCPFLSEDSDKKWMRNINQNLRLNQINIPGTHDSGTYAIGSNSLPIADIVRSEWGRTQSLDIYEQLLHGIRYLDIRLESNKDLDIYLTHNMFDCTNRKTGDLYYLKDVFDEIIDFLYFNPSETVIMHLKNDNVETYDDAYIEQKTEYPHVVNAFGDKFGTNQFYYAIGKLSINNTSKRYNKAYKDYFYQEEDLFPTLGKAKGKIVIYTRNDFKYKICIDKDHCDEVQIGKTIAIPEMGACEKDIWNSDQWNSLEPLNIPPYDVVETEISDYMHEICYPRISINNGTNILVQDNYNLLKKEKWAVVEAMLDNNIPSVFYKSTVNDKKKYSIFGIYHTNTTMFYTDDNVLTVNFMNIQAFMKIFRSIEGFADYINGELFKYFTNKNSKLHNQWMIFDFPEIDLLRRVRDIKNYELNKRGEFQNNLIQVGDYSIYTDLYYYIQTSSGNDDIPACLQRKTIISSQGQSQELVKTNYKCVDNKKNKWFIRQNGNLYSIVSSYDAKCLNLNGENLYMDYCKDNNKYQQFIIKNGKFCSQLNNSKCLGGKFTIKPSTLESPRYEHLTCASIFSELGYRCCYDENTKVEYVDEIGNWGVENGELCGIGYERCSFGVLGYPCCSSVNPEVVKVNENGSWGYEDDQWCGIGEATFNSHVRIRNLKTNQCLVTYPSKNSNFDRLVLSDCDTEYGLWSIIENKIISDYTKKCLYVNNGIDTAMDECDKVINGEDDHYIHFDVIDDKHICVKYNLDAQKCFNGNNLRFITSLNEYSEWAIERPNNNVVDSIESIIQRNHTITIGTFDSRIIIPSSTSTPEPTSECHSILGYPCYSPEITQVIKTDEEGSWGNENGDWGLINGNFNNPNNSNNFNNNQSTCSRKIIDQGFLCCSPENTQVINTDRYGKWCGMPSSCQLDLICGKDKRIIIILNKPA